MFGCSDVYHWMGFGTYLQHGQSPPVSTSRTAAVDTRTYHGSKVTRSTHRSRLLLSPTMLVLITDFRFRFSGPPAISRGSRARPSAGARRTGKDTIPITTEQLSAIMSEVPPAPLSP